MQEIVKRLGELIATLEAKLKEVGLKIVELNSAITENETLELKLRAKEDDLNSREAKILGPEELMVLSDKNKIVAAKAEKDLAEIKIKIAAYEAYQSQQMNAFSLKKQELDALESKINDERKRVQQDKLALEIEKKNLKAKIISELIDKS